MTSPIFVKFTQLYMKLDESLEKKDLLLLCQFIGNQRASYKLSCYLCFFYGKV